MTTANTPNTETADAPKKGKPGPKPGSKRPGVSVSARVPEALAERISELRWTLRKNREADVVIEALTLGIEALEAK